MSALWAIYRRELAGYFHTPAAYVFLAIFLFAAGSFTFFVGNWFETNSVDLAAFFAFHPWLFLIFLPAIAMRLWSEELRSGSIELLFTLPVPIWAAVLGKFLAAWTVAGAALALTAPFWISANVLGEPDNGAIATAYLGSLLLSGAYLAIGAAASALTSNAIVAFVLGVFIAFLFTVTGLPLVTATVSALAAPWFSEAVASLSTLERFASLQQGVVEARDIVYFASLIAAWLTFAGLVAARRREG